MFGKTTYEDLLKEMYGDMNAYTTFDNIKVFQEIIYTRIDHCLEKSNYGISMSKKLIYKTTISYLKAVAGDSLNKLAYLYRVGKDKQLEIVLLEWYTELVDIVINHILMLILLNNSSYLKKDDNDVSKGIETQLDISPYIQSLDLIYNKVCTDIKEQAEYVIQSHKKENQIRAKVYSDSATLLSASELLYKTIPKEEDYKADNENNRKNTSSSTEAYVEEYEDSDRDDENKKEDKESSFLSKVLIGIALGIGAAVGVLRD